MGPVRSRLEVLLVFAVAFLGYALLGRDVFYKTDGPDLVRLLHDHRLGTGDVWPHPWHVGYLPALDGFRRLLAAFGLEPGYLRLGNLFSALGMALGGAFVRAGCDRLSVPPWTARLCVGLLLLSPTALVQATVVEFHAPLMAPVGLAFWWTAVQAQRPTWWGMVLLGLATHVAFLMHASALFLPCWLLPLLLAQRWSVGQRRRDLGLCGLAGATHATLFLLLPRLFPLAYGKYADLSNAFATEASIGRPQTIDWTGVIFLQEWWWPLLPVSALVWLAPLRRSLRLEFAAFVLGFLPFLWLCVRQLVFEPEHGAYLLPMVLPAALLVARLLAPWPLAGIAVLLWLAIAAVVQAPATLPDRAGYDRFVAMARAAAGAQPMLLLVGRHAEMSMAFARLQPDEFLWLRAQATLPREDAGPHLVGVEGYLRARIATGTAVLLTAGGVATLQDPAAVMLQEKATLVVPPSERLAGPLFLERLRSAFELVPAGPADAAAAVFRLLPR